MAQQEYPSLNGIVPSWADIKITLPIYDGQSVEETDIAAIKWSDKVDKGVMRGTSGGRKKARTTGQYDADASITFYRSGWRRFRSGLVAINQKISLVGFDVLIQHTPPGESNIYNVKISGCCVIGRSHDMSEGTDPEKVEIPLSVMVIDEDGATLL